MPLTFVISAVATERKNFESSNLMVGDGYFFLFPYSSPKHIVSLPSNAPVKIGISSYSSPTIFRCFLSHLSPTIPPPIPTPRASDFLPSKAISLLKLSPGPMSRGF